MGVLTYEVEVTSTMPPQNLFKAMILNVESLLPKIAPQAISSFVTIEGDGGPGTIKQVKLSNSRFAKERVDAIDEENFKYAYSVIEGDVLMDILQKVSIEIQFEEIHDGGSICKRTSKYFTIENVEIKEEEIKGIHEKSVGLFIATFKAFEAYLLANPETTN